MYKDLRYDFNKPLFKFIIRSLDNVLPIILFYIIYSNFINYEENIKTKNFYIVLISIFVIILIIGFIKDIIVFINDIKKNKEYENIIKNGNLLTGKISNVSLNNNKYYTTGVITIFINQKYVKIFDIKFNKEFSNLYKNYKSSDEYNIKTYEYKDKYYCDLNSITIIERKNIT